MKLIFAATTLALFAACTATPPAPTPSTGAATAVAPSDASFTQMLNSFRAAQGQGPVRANPALTRAAQAHAEDMLERNYFSHRAPNGPNGETFGQRAASAGCAIQSGAENIAFGQSSQAEVFTGWQNSSGHRRNMLGPDYTSFGLGQAENIWVLKLSSGC
jgi:uncharacterized protein YkwD